MKKEITVFISEDTKTSKEIIKKYLFEKRITYANILPAEKRDEVVEAIEKLEDN
ncbi:hypothetical protein LCGC14_0972400 [marine sediment metagenome]|uniref:Response regulatory domain-containing protein n=1 Tax=marine sediment metagenome TaxID=412755 RepID=A0A0F9RHQ1_9ZZZZ